MKLSMYQTSRRSASAQRAVYGLIIGAMLCAGVAALGTAVRLGDSAGGLVGLLIVLSGVLLWAGCYNELNSFVEVNRKRVRVVEYSLFRRRERSFSTADIAGVRYVRHPRTFSQRIHVLDREGRVLLHVARCPEAERAFKRVLKES